MNNKVIEETLYPVGIALSPQLVLQRNQDIIAKYGIENFLRRGAFKRAREVYQTAVYALGATAKTGDFYWITPAADDPPDCYLIWKNGNDLFVECVEIAIWNEHIDDMWEIIQKKIAKQYPSKFSIVIHDSHDAMNISSEYYQKLHERLKSCSITAGAVRFWMGITNKPNRDVLIGEVFPTNTWTEFSSAHILQSYSLSPDIIRMDITTNPRRVTFSHNDLCGVMLPPLPELSWG